MFTSAASKEMDMLHGSIMDKLILFAIPAALSGILQQLLNALDVGIVGRFAGSDALAAVGMNGEIINFIIFMRIGIPSGIQSCIFCFANIAVQAKVNFFGPEAIAGASIAQATDILMGVAIVIALRKLLRTKQEQTI